MIFQLQRFAGDGPGYYEFEETSTNNWTGKHDSQVYFTISGVASITSVWTRVICTLAGALKDVTYTNATDDDIELTLDSDTYYMKAGVTNGKFVRELPEFGLMTKADKQKLDGIPTDFSNFITGGEMTADGFVLTNSAGVGVVTIPAQA